MTDFTQKRTKPAKAQGYQKREVGKSVYDLALERIRYVYDLFDTIAVSFSGGKDSTVVLNLALQVAHERNKLPLKVFFYDEEAIPYEVEHYVRRVYNRPDVNMDWWCIEMKSVNACTSDPEHSQWVFWDRRCPEKWVRPMPPEARTDFPNYHPEHELMSTAEITAGQFDPAIYGRVGILFGIRAAESLTRYQAVSRRKEENYIVREWADKAGGDFGSSKLGMGNTYKVYPIYDWQTSDVWTAPALYGWDYSTAYDLMEMAGVSHHNQRLAPPYPTQPMKHLWIFKVCFPDIWQKMQNRVPGANTAALYARTDIYADGRIEKPSGITWEVYIEQKLAELPDGMRKYIANVIRKYVTTHIKKTNNAPILPYVAHPNSGVSWEILTKIIIRRDNKGRIRPDMKMTSPRDPVKFAAAMAKWEQARIEYEMELAGINPEEGRF